MAEIVAGFGVPHTPMAPAQVQQDPSGETAQLYRAVAPRLPRARRCFALGAMVRAAVDAWPEQLRVAILASGSFSLEVSGPRVGITDHVWLNTVLRCLRRGHTRALLEQATEERML